MKHYDEKLRFIDIHKKWRLILFLAHLFNKKVVFWGASLFLEEFLTKYKIKSSNINGIIDKNYSSVSSFCGYNVFSPEKLKDLAPDYIIFAIRNNHKKIYEEIKSYIQNNFSGIKLLRNEFDKLEKFDSKFNNVKAAQINNIISEITTSKVVYLFQYSFFDKEGENFFSGGAERYMLDLSKLIIELGYKPILIQAGVSTSNVPWVKTYQGLTVIGVNTLGNNYFKIINSLREPDLAIYSGIIKWNKNIKYKNKLLISHGITWDVPRVNANIKFLQTILETFNNIISVDTSTISWMRSTFSNYVKHLNVNFTYVPNYVDITKYKPLKRDTELIKITFPRRCSDERGFWMFAEIVPELIKYNKNVLIEFVGYIHNKEIQGKIDKLLTGFPKNVIHRFCNQDEMVEVYQNTDISVIPTLFSEGTSLSCLEAMACGNAVIATNVGGLPNLILNNFNGKLINPESKSLFNALIELIDDKSLRQVLSQNAVSVSKTFAKENWDKEWRDILKRYL